MLRNILQRSFATSYKNQKIWNKKLVLKAQNLWILDTYGVLIPSNWKPMQQAFLRFGVLLTDNDIRKFVASSKHNHIQNLVREFLKVKDLKVENWFIERILEQFQNYQLKFFKENPSETTKIIDLQHLLDFQSIDGNKLVLTSMFPKQIVDYLSNEFKNQGFYPNAILTTSFENPTRSHLVEEALTTFPSEKTCFFVDTISDAKEISENFKDSVDVIGVIGHSAELPYMLSSRFIQEANANEVIASLVWRVD
jgi:hypothetical protein